MFGKHSNDDAMGDIPLSGRERADTHGISRSNHSSSNNSRTATARSHSWCMYQEGVMSTA
eukprot:2226242-Pyramimonas_sp.AAC.2